MSTLDGVRVGDAGTYIRRQITEDGEAVDVSGASSIELIVRRPDGSKETFTMSYSTSADHEGDGTDGWVEYRVLNDDELWTISGEYLTECEVTWGADSHHTTTSSVIPVYERVGS